MVHAALFPRSLYDTHSSIFHPAHLSMSNPQPTLTAPLYAPHHAPSVHPPPRPPHTLLALPLRPAPSVIPSGPHPPFSPPPHTTHPAELRRPVHVGIVRLTVPAASARSASSAPAALAAAASCVLGVHHPGMADGGREAVSAARKMLQTTPRHKQVSMPCTIVVFYENTCDGMSTSEDNWLNTDCK